MKSLNKQNASECGDVASEDGDNCDSRAYTVTIVSTMRDNEDSFRIWQGQAANLSRQKCIALDNLYEQKTDSGFKFVQVQDRTRIERSFSQSVDSDTEDTPVIKSSFPAQKQASQSQQAKPYAKIVFFKSADVSSHPFEQHAGKWAAIFNNRMAQFCAGNPRYSELRPLRFLPDCE